MFSKPKESMKNKYVYSYDWCTFNLKWQKKLEKIYLETKETNQKVRLIFFQI